MGKIRCPGDLVDDLIFEKQDGRICRWGLHRCCSTLKDLSNGFDFTPIGHLSAKLRIFED